MRSALRGVLALAMCLGVAGAALAQAAPAAEEKPAKPAKKEPVLWPAGDIQWTDVPEGRGSKQAVLWGDPATKGYGALNRWPAGLENPLHWHTFDIKGVVVSGTMVITMEGQAPKELPVGSYVMIPGRAKHTSACKAGADCVFFSEQNLRFDMRMPEAKK